MKVNQKSTRSAIICLVVPAFVLVALCFSCVQGQGTSGPKEEKPEDEYYVAAYVWPSCHDDEMGHEILWPDGEGEWEIIRKGNPRFEGHYQPKIPLWGYELDDDPEVMERWIDAATDHGVNVFIFDWYWFDEGPFLESSLNNGFLKASNNEKMQFYVMWANHNVPRNYWNVHRYKDDNSLLWDGATDMENFRIVVDRVIDQYFNKPNYFKIDGKPVFSIFNLDNLIKTCGGLEETKEGLAYLRKKTEEAGFPGVHIQLVIGGGSPVQAEIEKTEALEVNSITQYNWSAPHPEDYIRWGEGAIERRNEWDAALSIPYFPNASIGWDDSPRFPHKGKADIVHLNKSPEAFASFLQEAKEYCDARPEQPKLITVFSWNEWVEGSYLLPDRKYGFSHLEAVKKVVCGEYDKYSND